MALRDPNRALGSTIWAWALIAVVTVAVAVLAGLALTRTGTTGEERTAAPVPTFGLGVSPTAEAPPAQTPSPTPDAAPVSFAPAEERFLSAGSEGVMWRAIAGECGVTAPLIERSADDGATWSDVTPNYLGIGQIRSLDALAGVQAEIIADVGDECETQLLRTFTQGRFWEPYPDVLAASTYLSPTDPGIVITPAGEVEAPCATPWGLHASGGTVALLCDGAAYERSPDGAWAMLTDQSPLAVTVAGDDVVVAQRQDACDGEAIVRYPSSTLTGCAPAAATPVALATAGTGVWAWLDDAVSTVQE